MIEIDVDFRDALAVGRVTREGWSNAEESGTWMVGPASRLVLPPPPRHDGDFELRAVIGPYLAEGHVEAQRIRILVNATLVFETQMRGLMHIACPVPAEAMARQARVEIVIEHPDAVVPLDIGTGTDMRSLAASVWSMTILGNSPLPAERARVFGPPSFITRPLGNLANRMIQHMVALAVQAAAPNCAISGLAFPEWGIASTPDQGTWADLALVDEQHVDVAGVAALLASQTVSRVVQRGYGQRMANFLPRERYAGVFTSNEADITAYDTRHLLINIRSAEIVAGTISPYVLLPFAFYRDLILQTGLVPVFMGQLEPNAYTDALRAAFPDALFHDSQGAVRDFETIRRAANIVVAVSTFSWLAAWLSDATQIHLPVNGLLNPAQFPTVDLLPLDDPRYRFWLFPINHAAADFHAAHAAIDGQWHEVNAAALVALRDGAPMPAGPEPVITPALAPVLREGVQPIVARAEAAAARGYAVDVLHHLRQLPLMDYAELIWSLPRHDLPCVSALLPRMAPPDVQMAWNGKSGGELLQNSVDVCRILSAGFQRILGRPMEQIRVMDFGSGWGRMTRMMYYFTDPQRCCAVDAMEQSVARMAEDGVLGRIVKSSYTGEVLDVGDQRYDLILAYSVFTHTPMRVALPVLASLHRKLHRAGLLALTVRPLEYWTARGDLAEEQRASLIAAHRNTGFAFLPEGVTDEAGADIYGEASIQPEWFAEHCPEWELERIDRGIDEMQLVVFLSPR